MRALQLDFRREDLRARRLGAALLVAGLAAALAAAAQYRELSAQLEQTQAELHGAGTAARRSAPPRGGAEVQKVALEVKHANEILMRLKLPWNDLFASVESARTPDVALLAIESDTSKGRVKISGEARDLAAVLDYLRFLGTQPTLAEVYLQSHQVQQQDPQRPVRFVLNADWTARR